MNTKLKLIILLSVLCTSVSGFAYEIEVWHKLNTKPDEKLWFVAREEAAFIRDKIGNWLPIDLLRIRDFSEVSWKIDRLERLNNKIHFKILLRNNKNQIGTFEDSYFSKGKDGVLPCIVSSLDKEVYIQIMEEDNTVRRIMFKRGKDIEFHKKENTISQAMPFWDWDKANIVEM